MKFLFPAIVIGLVGGCMHAFTGLNKFVCLLIGFVAFLLVVFIKSMVVTIKVMRSRRIREKARNEKITMYFDSNGNLVDYE